MPITYTENFVTQARGVSAGGIITSGSLSMSAGDVVIALFTHESQATAGTPAIDLSAGSALTWTQIASTANASNNAKAVAWWALVDSTAARTVRVTAGDNNAKALHVIVHTGAHQTNPVPAANVFTAVSAASVSQTITPTASGSALWMVLADWNNSTFTAGTNCTRAQFQATAGAYSTATIRPTTQPRTDAAAFTLSETHTGSGVCWIALELQAAAVGGTPIAAVMHHRRMHSIS